MHLLTITEEAKTRSTKGTTGIRLDRFPALYQAFRKQLNALSMKCIILRWEDTLTYRCARAEIAHNGEFVTASSTITAKNTARAATDLKRRMVLLPDMRPRTFRPQKLEEKHSSLLNNRERRRLRGGVKTAERR